MATRMQQRRGTAAEWTAQNPVLAQGEVGFEIDTNMIKIGDGVTAWNSLPKVSTALSELTDVSSTAPEANQTLIYDGSEWVPGTPKSDAGDTIAMIVALGG